MQLTRMQINSLVLIGLTLVVTIATLSLTDQEVLQQHVQEFQIQALINSLIILLTTAIGVVMVGVGMAWLTSSHQFKGRKLLHWLLMLPLAMPPYLLAFSLIGVLPEGMLPLSSAHNGILVALFYIFSLYPFVYIPVRHTFSHRQGHYLDHSQMLGLSPTEVLFKLTLPKAYPALFAGLSIVMIETIADFATPALFGYQTLTTVLLNTQETSTPLTVLLPSVISLILIGALIQLCKQPFNKAKPDSAAEIHTLTGYQLSSKESIIAIAMPLSIGFIGFILPTTLFLAWGLSFSVPGQLTQLAGWLSNSLIMASATLVLGLLVIVIHLSPQQFKLLARVSHVFFNIAKAIPTTALAALVLVMLLIPFTLLGDGKINTSTVSDELLIPALFALVLVYLFHFVPSVMERFNLSLMLPANLSQPIGLSAWTSFRFFHLPRFWPAFIVLLIILTEVLRELPATYLLAPSGWETLAVACFDMVRNGMQEEAALPALLLIAIGLLPIPLFAKYSTS